MLSPVSFAHTDVLPSWFANAVGKVLGLGAHGFQVVKVDATHVQIPASANAGAAICTINGHFRWMETTVGPVAMPGGAGGIYPVFVTAKNDNIVNTPVPFTDNTDYTFGLQVLAPATTPTIVAGVVDIYRHVADVLWDGAKIVTVTQIVPATPSQPGALPVGAQVPYTGSGDPGPGEWVIADGRLLDSTVYAAFDLTCGRSAVTAMKHAYNAGVDPGSNKVRIPDKRGKKSAGAINMGTGAGANDNAHAQLTNGRSGGEVLHSLTAGENGAHAHGVSITSGTESAAHAHGPAAGGNFMTSSQGINSFQASGSGPFANGTGSGNFGAPTNNNNPWGTTGATAGENASHSHAVSGSTDGGGASGTGHNNADPYETDSWLVRVA